MNYIMERKELGNQYVYRITADQFEQLKKLMETKKASDIVELNGLHFQLGSVVAFAPADTWWKNDEQAQKGRGRQRCPSCLIVYPNGTNCPCVKPVKTFTVDTPRQLTPAELKAGWIRAIKIALAYPNVTVESPLVQRFMRKYEVKAGEL